MTRHALERDRDVRLRRALQIALRGRQMEILDRPDEGRAVARVVGMLQDDPARIVRETLQLAAVSFEGNPVAGDDGLEDLLRVTQFLAHDVVQGRPLTTGSRGDTDDCREQQEYEPSLGHEPPASSSASPRPLPESLFRVIGARVGDGTSLSLAEFRQLPVDFEAQACRVTDPANRGWHKACGGRSVPGLR